MVRAEDKNRLRRFLKRRLRPLLLAGIVGFTVMEIVALSPSSIEQEDTGANTPVDPQALMPDNRESVATGIPERIPEYQVERFDYVSTQGGERQWQLKADRSAMFNKEKLVHAKKIIAHLFDPDGRITLVTGREAKYFMNQRDLEVYGDVVATFPDGFELFSDYLRYKPNERIIEIPNRYRVKGGSKSENGQDMKFESNGFHFWMAKSEILLPENVKLMMMKSGQPDDTTVIDSDKCVIHRGQQKADFSMLASRAPSQRYVHITQPTLFTRSRTARLNYGDSSSLVQYLVAFDDVLIKQIAAAAKPTQINAPSPKPKDSALLKYATAGQADFDNRKNLVILTRFPQVYQDNDTVTGDVIKLHRDSDVVEVQNSNSFSEGTEN